MREKLQTLPLSELKEMAKSRGIKGISSLRKAEIIDLLCDEAEKNPEVKPAEIKREERTETARSQETPRGAEGSRSQEPYRSQDQSHAPERSQLRSQDYQENRNDSRGTDNRRPISRGYDNKYAQNRTQSPKPHGNNSQNSSMSQNSTPSQNEGERFSRADQRNDAIGLSGQDMAELDSGIEANGILEVMPDGFGFIRCENFLPGENDVYVAPSQIRRFNLKTGDIIVGNRRVKSATEKFAALLYIKTVNGYSLSATETRPNFEDLTPIFPNRRLHMETPGEKNTVAMRVLDLLAPIGKGQRGMIVSPPKAGKTTLLKQVAKAVTTNNPEVIYSTFDELPDRHKRVSEMVIERAKRLVEHGRDVIILLDSITRLARAYNLTVAPSGRTLSGGLDPAALHMPKRFFGAARNMREGGSLTVLATALVDTGSRMDDVVYEEFKGTGNMELVLDRKLSEKRIFPAIDILKSGTRRDDLLLTREEAEAVDVIRKATNSLKPEDAVEKILDLFARTRNNREFVENAKRIRFY